MGKYEALAISVIVVAIVSSFAVSGWSNNHTKTETAVSCNNLKAAAVEANQPIPKCHGEL